MNEHDNLNHDDLLERATRSLSETPVPDGPPQPLVENLLAALDSRADRPKHATLTRRIFTMKSIIRMAVAATILLALGLGVLWIVSQSGPKLAFADVADTFLGIRTATCRMTVEATGPGAKDDPLVKAMQALEMKSLFLAPSRQRMETSKVDPKTGKTEIQQITIMDMSQGKSIQLTPETKMAMVMQWENLPASEKSTVVGFLDARQFIANARQRDVAVDTLEEKTIDGREVVGFSVKDKARCSVEFWADAKTGLPVRFEIHWPAGTLANSALCMVMDDFRTNVELDESLFNLEIPEGYSPQNVTVDGSEPTFTDLAPLIRALAEENNGVLPDELPGPKDLHKIVQRLNVGHTKEIMERHKGENPPKLEPGEMQAMMDKMMPISRGIGFMATLAPENDWHYDGKGITLGTPERAIFWYKPADSDQYKVLYADLTVKELDAGDLPNIESPDTSAADLSGAPTEPSPPAVGQPPRKKSRHGEEKTEPRPQESDPPPSA